MFGTRGIQNDDSVTKCVQTRLACGYPFFLPAEGYKPVNIHRRMIKVYGNACLIQNHRCEMVFKVMVAIRNKMQVGRPFTSKTADTIILPEGHIQSRSTIALNWQRLCVN